MAASKKLLARFSRLGLVALACSLFATVLSGCSEPEGPSIAGDWEVQKPGSPATLHAKADKSFSLDAPTGETLHGRWVVEGHTVKLYRDIRDGGDLPFGEGGDGASVYTLSKDLTTMNAGSGPNTATFKKVK
jgi:hypothetical protein